MKIKNIKKKGNKYQIVLDNSEDLIVNDHVLINNNLLYKNKITAKDLDQIKKEAVYYEHYSKVLNMLNRKKRSQYEIASYLNKNNVSQEESDKIINHLKEIGFINDEEYAESYINDKIGLTLDGPYKIKKELEEKHIDDTYISNVLEIFTDDLIDEKIDRLINKKLKTNNKDTEYIFKQKMSLYLSNMGYSKDDIYSHLDSIKIDNKHLEKEMEKIYEKLKQKYSGYTLQNKLKQKLYAKGFKSEEINDFIQKTVH